MLRELRDLNLNRILFASLDDPALGWIFFLFPGLKSGGVLFLGGLGQQAGSLHLTDARESREWLGERALTWQTWV